MKTLKLFVTIFSTLSLLLLNVSYGRAVGPVNGNDNNLVHLIDGPMENVFEGTAGNPDDLIEEWSEEQLLEQDVSIEYIYVSWLDDKKYYLEGRGKSGDDEHPILVALELTPDSKENLYVVDNAKLYACIWKVSMMQL